MIKAVTLTVDCETLACQGGLRYVNRFDEGIFRRRCGRGFRYVHSSGSIITSASLRNRIQGLVIPPAWTDVWICSEEDGHIQAVGRDELGRKQYIYHPKWHELSAATKFERMALMLDALPRIRARVRDDLVGSKLTRERVIAAIVRVLDKAHIRVGNEQYVKERDTRGATTLTSDHVQVVNGFTVVLDFPGKSGKRSEVEFTDRKVAKVIRQCEEIEGHYLFSYFDETGQLCQTTSSDVNNYLREVAGQPITAKDFRTWWGSVTALDALAEFDDSQSPTARKRAIVAAVRQASELLGNTLAVCRKSYIHPKILTSFEAGTLAAALKRCQRSAARPRREMQPAECRFAAWLTREADRIDNGKTAAPKTRATRLPNAKWSGAKTDIAKMDAAKMDAAEMRTVKMQIVEVEAALVPGSPGGRSSWNRSRAKRSRVNRPRVNRPR